MDAFESEVIPRLKPASDKPFHLLVLGGTPLDPEVGRLAELYDRIDLHFCGIDSASAGAFRFTYLDFNLASGALSKVPCDLAVSVGVVEHLWNLHQMFANFAELLEVDALLWIAFPVSNFPHGSPEWYMTGCHPSMIVNIAELFGFSSLSSGFLGDRRNYLFRHLLNLWPHTADRYWFAYRWPIVSYLPTPGSMWTKLWHQISTIPTRVILQMARSVSTGRLVDASVGYCLLRRI